MNAQLVHWFIYLITMNIIFFYVSQMK